MTSKFASLFRRLLPLLLFCAAVSSLCASEDIHHLADGVDHRYNALRTMQVQFTEHYSGNGIDRTESGTLWLKKPGKMRWEYQSPHEKVFVSDGKMAWFYVPGANQVREAHIKNLDDLRSPLRYLIGHTKLEKEFTGLSLAPDVKPTDAGNIMLRGIPISMADRVSQVLLEISPDHRILRLLVAELDGSTTEFQFNQEQDNPELPDGRFAFKPPPNVEILQGSELTSP